MNNMKVIHSPRMTSQEEERSVLQKRILNRGEISPERIQSVKDELWRVQLIKNILKNTKSF